MPRGQTRSNVTALILAAIAAIGAAASAPGCGGPSIELVGGDDGGEVGDATEGESADGTAEADIVEDGGTPCPIWATSSGDGGTHRGSPDDPLVGLAAALEARGSCDHIILAAQAGDPPFDPDVEILVPAGGRLMIEGDPDAEERPILDAGGRSSGLRAAGDGRLELRHLSIQNAVASEGPGLRAETRELHLEDTLWIGCAAEADGGAILANVDSLTLSGSTFRSNSAGGSGGAVFIDGPSDAARVRVDSCTFERNAADAGGGLFLAGGSTDVRVSGSRFAGNSAVEIGSAIGGHVGVEIVGNRFEANEGGFRGGAVAGNGAWDGGRIAQNIFVGNRVRVEDWTGFESWGAALVLNPAYALVANNLFVENATEVAPGLGVPGVGAVSLLEGNAKLRNNTFVDNSSVGGVAHLRVYNGEVVANLIVGGAGACSAIVEAVAGGSATVTYNDSWDVPEPAFAEGTVVGEGDLRADPLFVDPLGGDYRLSAGSPCVDTGDPAEEWRDPDGSRNDIGAFGGPGGEWIPLGPTEGP